MDEFSSKRLTSRIVFFTYKDPKDAKPIFREIIEHYAKTAAKWGYGLDEVVLVHMKMSDVDVQNDDASLTILAHVSNLQDNIVWTNEEVV